MNERVIDTISILGIAGTGHHGVYAFEREEGQPFLVDVILGLHVGRAASTDQLTNTVDYGEVAQMVHARIVGEPVSLLETLANQIAADCLRYQAVHTVTVRVHKPKAPIPVPFDDIVISITRHR